jgi:hypothetical protein
MAELVDALVSNTSGSNAVPVRSRLRVLKKSGSESESGHSRLFFLTPAHTHTFFLPGWQGRAIRNCPQGQFPRGASMQGCVDALVSNTSGSNAVPVRSRLRVQKKSGSESESGHSRHFFLTPTLTLTFSSCLIISGQSIHPVFQPEDYCKIIPRNPPVRDYAV